MTYEYPTVEGTLHLVRREQGWAIRFNGRLHGQWPSPDEAANAVARHMTGLPRWDRAQLLVPDDLLCWRPLGGSL